MLRNRLIIPAAIGLVVLLVAVVLIQSSGRSRSSTTTTVPTAAVEASPYDLTEAPGDLELATLPEAKFASILLETPEGLTSYMVAADQAAFEAIARSVAAARAVDEPAPDSTSTLTFVMPDRVTVTFVLDTAAGLIAREGTVWRAEGDLAALVRAVTDRAAAQ
ncbi:MAG TPA: hypothetical protein VFE45_01200 [Coriobacteriia bacterium]|nr:hypothetical protein [Coriobacteriia bacterium]